MVRFAITYHIKLGESLADSLAALYLYCVSLKLSGGCGVGVGAANLVRCFKVKGRISTASTRVAPLCIVSHCIASSHCNDISSSRGRDLQHGTVSSYYVQIEGRATRVRAGLGSVRGSEKNRECLLD